jgi:hypothetical protein
MATFEQTAKRIYHLKGPPFDVGYALGQALGPRLETNIERYIRARRAPGPTFDANRWHAGALPWLHSLPSRFTEEFKGLAQGAGLPLQRVAEWAYLEIVLAGQCSGAIVTLNDQVWVARNNDSFAPGLWGYVTIREVDGRIPALSFGLEGDVFTPTGINKKQLWLHYNYLPAWDRPQPDRPHLPGYAWMVEALETCRTLPDVEALLQRVQRDDGMLLFAVDGKTDAYALYECSCTSFHKREPNRGWLVGTNHYVEHPQTPALGSAQPGRTVHRYERLQQLIEGLTNARYRDATPVKELIQILADHGVEARTGDTVTVYANVACPGTQQLWHTFGGYPAASQGNWQRLAWPW